MNTTTLEACSKKNSSSDSEIRVTQFSDYISQNIRATALLALLIFAQMLGFKAIYPYPSFFSDSDSYIYAAATHLNVNVWPIGYSWFLRAFHNITHSAQALIFFQYLFLETAALYLYHTFVFLLSPNRLTRTILMIVLFFDPLNLYLANFISSDGLFVGLSLIWLSELLWIIYRPNLYHLIILSFACLIAFTFRYNAMIYPLIGLLVFFLAPYKMSFKLAGILLAPVLVLSFIIFSSNAAKKMSGYSQFPPILGGWQWANNALYMRENIEEDSAGFLDPQMAELDGLAREFNRKVPPENRKLSPYVGNYFIREKISPLRQYVSLHYSDSNTRSRIIAWAKVAPIYKEYGLYLIKRHPIPFFHHYLLINAKNYFLPSLEKLEVYNQGLDEMPFLAKQWFHYPDWKVTAVSKTFQGYILFPYPTLFLFVNLYFAWQMLLFIQRRGLVRSERKFVLSLGMICTLLVLNAAFSIFANIIVFRYQVFPLFALLIAGLLLAEKNINLTNHATNNHRHTLLQ